MTSSKVSSQSEVEEEYKALLVEWRCFRLLKERRTQTAKDMVNRMSELWFCAMGPDLRAHLRNMAMGYSARVGSVVSCDQETLDARKQQEKKA